MVLWHMVYEIALQSDNFFERYCVIKQEIIKYLLNIY